MAIAAAGLDEIVATNGTIRLQIGNWRTRTGESVPFFSFLALLRPSYGGDINSLSTVIVGLVRQYVPYVIRIVPPG